MAQVESAAKTSGPVWDFRTAIQSIARHFGRSASDEVLFSGIYLEKGVPDSAGLERIASQIGLTVVELIVSGPDDSRIEYPAIFELKDGRHVAVLSRDESGVFTVSNGQHLGKIKSDSPVFSSRGIVRALQFSLHYANTDERSAIGDGGKIEKHHWLFGTIRKLWRGYAYVALAAVFINLIALAVPIFTMNVYDRILPNKATSSLLALAVGVCIALIFDFLLKSARSTIIDETGREADLQLSYKLFDKVLNTSLAARPASTGEYASRISQIEFVREFFTSNTISTVIDSVFAFLFIAVIFLIGGWLAVIPFVALLVALAIGYIAQLRIGRRVARAANESSQRQSLLVESISTIETIKSLRAEGLLLRKWHELTKNSSRTSEDIKQISAGATNATMLVQQLVSVVIIIAGSFEFAAGNMSTGAIIASVMLSGRTVGPLTQIAMTLARMRQATLSLRILDSIMNMPEDRPNSAGFISRPIKSGRFQFEDAGFQYPGTDVTVLKNLNITVSPGEKVGIIGKIGSGKTTIGRILSGLYAPSSGRLLIDNIDVRQFHPAMVRSSVAFVGQSADLFTGSLKENLLMANPEASDDELIAAAQKAGVDEFAILHPRGYDLAVGERGTNLSGGQRQAVAIARLLLAKPKIVFLDEPTGAMDMASEKRLIQTLSSAFDPETTLVISTHRHSLLDIVNRLIVLDNGRVIADGPKAQVLAALVARAQEAARRSA